MDQRPGTPAEGGGGGGEAPRGCALILVDLEAADDASREALQRLVTQWAQDVRFRVLGGGLRGRVGAATGVVLPMSAGQLLAMMRNAAGAGVVR